MPLRVRATWTGSPVTGPTVSTFFFNEAAGTAQDASDQVATFLSALDANLSDQLTWRTEGEVDELNTVTGELEAVTAVSTATGTGSNTDVFLPTSTQGLLRWSTGTIVNGRVLKGRMFVPGFCENNNTDGRPGAATIAAVNTIVSAFITDSPAIFVVWSRTHGVQAQVTGGPMWEQWAYLSTRRD